ncbi:LexA family protein [Agrobacterium tumefaciens]|uniref:LexA family protein n=2 Tax=Agrobacterium tumefaciens TaxID=358 RepID=UPI00157447C9|nr:hypothetical protein [Agrobacterium tumefaciens]NTD84268.1 hypothetical protein [Agrobacterium tumefaciens]NTE13894.1 hypothetical protein [Agrobacterium tumefaciens]
MVVAHKEDNCDDRKYMSSNFCDIRYRKICDDRENPIMNDKRKEIRDWLASELERKGHGAKGKLATFLGIRPEGVTRILGKSGKEGREVAADELLKMSEFFGSTPPGLKLELTPVDVRIETIPVRGKVAASSWLDVEDMDFGWEDMEQVPTISGYPREWQFALAVEGNCLNKKAEHGDVLICLDIIKAGISFKENDLVIVERKKFDGQMVQRTAKRVRRAIKGFELWPESTDPAHQEPLILYENTPGETVTVIGIVLWIFRKP